MREGPMEYMRRRLRKLRHRAAVRAEQKREAARIGLVRVTDVHARLEHYLRAMYGRTIRVEAIADTPIDEAWVRRAQRRMASGTIIASESDESVIRLPSELRADADGVDAVTRYRVLAVQHAERHGRGSVAFVAELSTPLERDLYWIAESRAVDASIAATQPGLVPALDAARASGIATRPLPPITPLGRRVEGLLLDALRAPMETEVLSPSASVEWARTTAAALMRTGGATLGEYEGVAPIAMWGATIAVRSAVVAAESRPASDAVTRVIKPSPKRKRHHKDPDSGTLDSHAASDDAPHDGDEQDDVRRESPDSADGEEDSAMVLQPGASVGTEAPSKREARRSRRKGILYPEWDRDAGDYYPEGALVRVLEPAVGSPDWADRMLREHAVLVRQARGEFERLKSQRLRLTRQAQGDDLDLDACVAALVDRKLGVQPDERLYATVRPGRRPLAIALLLDVSKSTRETLLDGQRVIDVERLAALVAAEAFDAMGDEYAVFAFSSDGAADVRLTHLKEFAQPNGIAVRERVSALEPDGRTRLGAAIRHAAAQLVKRETQHRLLIILSDGKPNDRDRYFVDYGVDDSRKAVLEARSAGVHPYCITVDREEAAEYMADIFGPTGYLTVQRPEQLPRALVRSVERLLG